MITVTEVKEENDLEEITKLAREAVISRLRNPNDIPLNQIMLALDKCFIQSRLLKGEASSIVNVIGIQGEVSDRIARIEALKAEIYEMKERDGVYQ